MAWGCKPANEPPRHEEAVAAPDVSMSTTTASDDAAVAALGSLRVVMHEDRPAGEQAQAKPTVRAEAEGTASEEPASEDRRLAPEALEALIEAARVEPTGDAEATAKRLNARGLKHHKRLDLSQAITEYRSALRAWPGHLYARYNLACALQLRRRPQESFDQLAVLNGLKDRGGLDLLREARLDDDFKAARPDPRFRKLTGYIPVEVAAASDTAQARLKPVRTQLLDVHVPATIGERWPKPVADDTLYVRGEDAAAADMADEIMDALGSQVVRQSHAGLGPKRPVVLVVAEAARAPEEKADSKAPSPETFIGVHLTSEQDGALHRLHLKERRFFSWETRHEDGRRIGRTGTYYFLREKLHLDFQETTETPSEFEEPTIEVHRGKREHHSVSTDGVTLQLGDLSFRKR